MRRRHCWSLIAMGMVLMLSSCATKQSAVNNLRALQQEVETNGMMYNLKDWKKAAQDYAKINKKIYKKYNEYTPQELEEIGRLNSQCAASFAKGATQAITNKVQGVTSLIKGFVEGVKENVDNIK